MCCLIIVLYPTAAVTFPLISITFHRVFSLSLNLVIIRNYKTKNKTFCEKDEILRVCWGCRLTQECARAPETNTGESSVPGD